MCWFDIHTIGEMLIQAIIIDKVRIVIAINFYVNGVHNHKFIWLLGQYARFSESEAFTQLLLVRDHKSSQIMWMNTIET